MEWQFERGQEGRFDAVKWTRVAQVGNINRAAARLAESGDGVSEGDGESYYKSDGSGKHVWLSDIIWKDSACDPAFLDVFVALGRPPILHAVVGYLTCRAVATTKRAARCY